MTTMCANCDHPAGNHAKEQGECYGDMGLDSQGNENVCDCPRFQPEAPERGEARELRRAKERERQRPVDHTVQPRAQPEAPACEGHHVAFTADGFKRAGERTIDDLAMRGADVHLEQLDDGCFMLIVENGDHHWHLRIAARGRGKVDAWMYERWSGDEWQQQRAEAARPAPHYVEADALEAVRADLRSLLETGPRDGYDLAIEDAITKLEALGC